MERAVDDDLLAKNTCVSAEPLTPERLAQDDDRNCPFLGVGFGEESTEQWSDAKDVEY
jgi:hypothetical protein